MLTQEEDAYLEFLRLRNVSIAEAPASILLPLTIPPTDATQKLRGKTCFVFFLKMAFEGSDSPMQTSNSKTETRSTKRKGPTFRMCRCSVFRFVTIFVFFL